MYVIVPLFRVLLVKAKHFIPFGNRLAEVKKCGENFTFCQGIHFVISGKKNTFIKQNKEENIF